MECHFEGSLIFLQEQFDILLLTITAARGQELVLGVLKESRTQSTYICYDVKVLKHEESTYFSALIAILFRSFWSI